MLLDNALGKKFEENLKVMEYRPLLLGRISQFTRLTCGATCITAVTLGFLTFAPIVYTLKHKKYLYIFQGKYPFPVEGGSWLYWSVITMEASAGFFMWTLVSGVDNAFGLHTFRMCGMLRLLGYKYSQLRSVTELVECVRIHQLLLRCRDALQRVYGPIILLTYLTSSLIMCSLMYQANQLKTQRTNSRLFFVIFYIVLKLLQAFTYAYYGALISMEIVNTTISYFFLLQTLTKENWQ